MKKKKKKKLKKRNLIAKLLSLPMLRNKIIQNKKKTYNRKKQKQLDLKLFQKKLKKMLKQLIKIYN